MWCGHWQDVDIDRMWTMLRCGLGWTPVLHIEQWNNKTIRPDILPPLGVELARLLWSMDLTTFVSTSLWFNNLMFNNGIVKNLLIQQPLDSINLELNNPWIQWSFNSTTLGNKSYHEDDIIGDAEQIQLTNMRHCEMRVSWFQMQLKWASWGSTEATALPSCFHFP